MSTTQPLKKINEIEQLKQYFRNKGEIRNYVLVTMGINTALRISDLLQIQWKDVWNFDTKRFREHIIVTEQKTKKIANVYLNHQCRQALSELKDLMNTEVFPAEYIFKSQIGQNKPIGRNRAYVIIAEACHELGYKGKSGYHFHDWSPL